MAASLDLTHLIYRLWTGSNLTRRFNIAKIRGRLCTPSVRRAWSKRRTRTRTARKSILPKNEMTRRPWRLPEEHHTQAIQSRLRPTIGEGQVRLAIWPTMQSLVADRRRGSGQACKLGHYATLVICSDSSKAPSVPMQCSNAAGVMSCRRHCHECSAT